MFEYLYTAAAFVETFVVGSLMIIFLRRTASKREKPVRVRIGRDRQNPKY